jgi:hypothetical protein
MAKSVGISFNRVALQGRVEGDPVINGEWLTLNLKTLVPKLVDNKWTEAEVMVPLLTNDPKRVESMTSFIQNERQLYVEGYIESWDGGCGVFVTLFKLGSKTAYDSEAQGQQGGNKYPGK